ncbi:late competence development ComFB family protein [Piscinibacter sakaiensis]|uniref:Late competence development protein ComFB n=1 Tax=Piscinibacter sakaiensis TaxID=1547922 RepID=A0A0K8P3H5_PISS1|nr:late competence development ComFB family protein [Piscinibacter sakaiensis]GAP37163.1 hypothetical protein ISF6_3018 [Piscinibacter sakaiensis]
MSVLEQIHNHHEGEVVEAIARHLKDHPGFAGDADVLGDIACLALNRLPPRYIRHSVDYAFYRSEQERLETARAIEEAVQYAFAFVTRREPR